MSKKKREREREKNIAHTSQKIQKGERHDNGVHKNIPHTCTNLDQGVWIVSP
jgi:hypothetical protein